MKFAVFDLSDCRMEAAIRGGKWGKSSRSNRNSQPRQYLFHQRYPSVPQLHRPASRILRPGPGNFKIFKLLTNDFTSLQFKTRLLFTTTHLYLQYKSDLKRKRRLHALSALQKGASCKGEVTEQLACVLKSLWSLQVNFN